MSQWHPPPPYWYKSFAASPAALAPPSLEGVPSPAVVADSMTFAHPEGIRPPPVPEAAHHPTPAAKNGDGNGAAAASSAAFSPTATHAELKRLKKQVVGDFIDILEIVSQARSRALFTLNP